SVYRARTEGSSRFTTTSPPTEQSLIYCSRSTISTRLVKDTSYGIVDVPHIPGRLTGGSARSDGRVFERAMPATREHCAKRPGKLGKVYGPQSPDVFASHLETRPMPSARVRAPADI